ncbi:MAG: N-acetylmuramoyl-L-alanine amidase [Hyphomicrobiaceae bacterium]
MIECRDHPSANCEPRAPSAPLDMLILHYTATDTAEAAIRWLADPASKVSCHYVVDDDGTITRMVAETERAWHAGISYWRGERDINSRSIGIEIQNVGPSGGYPQFPELQMRAVVRLCQDVVERHRIPRENVLAHSDVAPFRKVDPGEKFDWARLARAGVGLWIDPPPPGHESALGVGSTGPAVAELTRLLAALGYEITESAVFDQSTNTILKAFQMHWRPARVDGRGDASTFATLRRLLDLRDNRP